MTKQLNTELFQEKVATALKEGRPLLGKGGVFTPFLKMAIEAVNQGEMDVHLLENKLEGSNNRRNGNSVKTISSDIGSFELNTPRDRDGTFEPQIIKKRQTIIEESLDQKILSLFSAGMSYDDICHHVKQMYDHNVSAATISKITDRLIPIIDEWRSRPLANCYPIIFLDAMFFNVREESHVVSKAMYNILGINHDGKKEVLGFYIGDSESSKFWMAILSDLKERGVKDILIACVDGLKGFPEAINAIFPQTAIQLCIVHQIRNSMKYVKSSDQKEFMMDLKKVYQAKNKNIAESSLLQLDEKWGKKYSIVLKSWNNNWEALSQYFTFTKEIRRVIYTTNPVEGLNRQIRKYTKTKGAFTSENALCKVVYSAIISVQRKWDKPIQNWSIIVSQLDIAFPKRMKTSLNLGE